MGRPGLLEPLAAKNLYPQKSSRPNFKPGKTVSFPWAKPLISLFRYW
jgi:hypothetical protein